MTASLQSQSGPADVQALRSPGGIDIWQVRSSFVPLVALAFVFEGGATQDPPGKGGAVQLLARLLDEGAGPYRSDAFQDRLAEHAIELNFTCGPDAVGGSLKTLIEHSDDAFELLRLAVTEPRFDQDAVDRVKAQTIAGLRYQANDPGNIASKRFLAEAFPGHPYGLPASGTVETVAAVTRDDLVALHGRLLATGRLKIAAVGDMTGEDITRRIDDTFGRLRANPELDLVPAVELTGLGTQTIDDLDVPQSVIRFGFAGASWRDPDFTPTYVLNHILGGGAFTSRLFQEVRERRGLAYSVGTSLVSYRRTAMTWGYTATKNERVAECLEVIASEIRRLGQDGPSDDELGKAKDYLMGSYALGFDTSTKIAHQLAQIAFEDLGIDYIRRRNELVAAVTQDDIARVAARIFGEGKMLVAIAGRPVGA